MRLYFTIPAFVNTKNSMKSLEDNLKPPVFYALFGIKFFRFDDEFFYGI